MNTRMNQEMISLLRNLKDKRLINIECKYEEKFKRTYGYLRLNTDDVSIDITNIVEPMSLFGEVEDVAVFRCYNNTGKSIKEAFKLVDYYETSLIEISEIIKNISIVHEKVIKNSSEEMIFDMCIIIETENHKYLISRKNWFMELIYINKDEEFDNIYPIEEDKQIWTDYFDTTIERIVEEL